MPVNGLKPTPDVGTPLGRARTARGDSRAASIATRYLGGGNAAIPPPQLRGPWRVRMTRVPWRTQFWRGWTASMPPQARCGRAGRTSPVPALAGRIRRRLPERRFHRPDGARSRRYPRATPTVATGRLRRRTRSRRHGSGGGGAPGLRMRSRRSPRRWGRHPRALPARLTSCGTESGSFLRG